MFVCVCVYHVIGACVCVCVYHVIGGCVCVSVSYHVIGHGGFTQRRHDPCLARACVQHGFRRRKSFGNNHYQRRGWIKAWMRGVGGRYSHNARQQYLV